MIEFLVCDIDKEMQKLIKRRTKFFLLDENIVNNLQFFNKTVFDVPIDVKLIIIVLKNTNPYFRSLFELGYSIYNHYGGKLLVLTDFPSIITYQEIYKPLMKEKSLKVRILGEKVQVGSISYNDAYFYLQILIAVRAGNGLLNK